MENRTAHGPDRVLIINNSIYDTTQDIRQHLSGLGYEIVFVTNSHAGVRAFLLTPHRYRMIIVDIGTEDIPSIDLARLIFELNINPNTSVILHSTTGNLILKNSKKGIRAKKLPQYLLGS